MSDDLVLQGKAYVSSKKAAELTGYARDYIGQLSRGGLIDAQRVGGLWYVAMDSLEEYRKNAENAVPVVPVAPIASDPESLVSFDGKDYVSASRASKISGYNQDYIGQLARGGKIASRQIGNRWYIDREALMRHKSEKDSLLAAVQASSVGLPARTAPTEVPHTSPATPILTYTPDERDLMPIFTKTTPIESLQPTYPAPESGPRTIAIRKSYVMPAIPREIVRELPLRPAKGPSKGRGKTLAIAGSALTVVIVLAYGAFSLQKDPKFAENIQNSSLGASAASAWNVLGDRIENIVSPLMKYERAQ